MASKKNLKYIKKVNNGRYRIIIRVGVDFNGKNIYVSKQLSNVTIDEVIAERDKMLEETKEKDVFDGNMKLELFAEKWITDVVMYTNASTTIDDKKTKLKNYILPYIGKYKMKDIDSQMIQNYINYLTNIDLKRKSTDGTTKKLSDTTIKNIYNVLCALFTYASSRNVRVIKETPCNSDIVLPKRDKEYKPNIYTESEITDLIDIIEQSDSLSTHHRVIFLLALCCGLRRGEIAALTWNDIYLEDGYINIDKSLSYSKVNGLEIKKPKSTSGIRVVGINDLLVKYFKDHKKYQQEHKNTFGSLVQENDYVFTNDFGDRYSINSITKSWNNFVKKYDLKKVKFHGLRASFASFLSANGIPMKEISDALGHSRITTTERFYTFVYPDYHKRIVNITNKIGEKYIKNSHE